MTVRVFQAATRRQLTDLKIPETVAFLDETGKVFELKAGDLIQFSAGAKVNFSSESSGLAFYVAQR